MRESLNALLIQGVLMSYRKSVLCCPSYFASCSQPLLPTPHRGSADRQFALDVGVISSSAAQRLTPLWQTPACQKSVQEHL